MKRLSKLISTLLALLLAASGAAASLNACPHSSRVTNAAAHDLHACCRAMHAHQHSHAATHVEMSEHASREATDVQTIDARASVHGDGNCAASHERDAAQSEMAGDGDAPCTGCCSARAAAQPRALATAGAQESKQSPDARASQPPHAPASNVPLHISFAPTGHAPPASSTRLHILIGILLI